MSTFDITSFLESLNKLSPKLFLAILIASSLLLLSPYNMAGRLGMLSLTTTYRPYIGAAWLLSLCVLLALGIIKCWELASNGYKKRQQESLLISKLSSLTNEEKSYISDWVKQGKRSNLLRMSDPIVAGLVAHGIIARTSKLSRSLDLFPYIVEDWAWKHFLQHPELLGLEHEQETASN